MTKNPAKKTTLQSTNKRQFSNDNAGILFAIVAVLVMVVILTVRYFTL